MSLPFVKPQGPFKLQALAELVGAELYRHGEHFSVIDIAPLSQATGNKISMLHQKKYLKELSSSMAGACILAPQYISYAPEHMFLLVHNNPYKAFALIAQRFYPRSTGQVGIAPTAYVASSATLGKRCSIAHGAYIGEHVIIGDDCTIGVNTFIGNQVVLGDECVIDNNVSIQYTRMGSHVRVYPGACIGQEGFSFASDAQGHYNIPHIGGVTIGNHVEIGANTCIDRGSLNDTVIEDWCRLDNLIQIGHNVTIGEGSILCGQVGIAGSSKIGKKVTLAGKVGVSGHVTIGDGATILAASLVIRDVPKNARLGGHPAIPDKDWHKQNWHLKKLWSRKG